MLSYWAIDQVNMAELEDPMIADASINWMSYITF